MNSRSPSFFAPAAGLALAVFVFSVPVPAAELAALRVQSRPVELTFPVDGLVEAAQQANIAAQVGGRVSDLRVDAGQRVKKGELLLRIEAVEAAEAVAGAAAQLTQARAAHERARQLHLRNFISQAALDKAKTDLEVAQAASGQARAGQGHAVLASPMNGIVARRWIEAGEMALPGKPLLMIYDPQGLRLTAQVAQSRLPDLRAVRQAKVEFPELGLWVDALRVTLLPATDAATHVTPVRVDLPADVPAALLPGMAARVHFVTGRASRLTVPVSAVVRRGEVAVVYVLPEAGGRPVLRQLRLGETLAGSVEVLAGLAEGEQVALDPVKAAVLLRSPVGGK